MDILKTLATLALGSALLAGCGADKDTSSAQTETPPAAETAAPPPADEMPADAGARRRHALRAGS